MKLLNNMKCMKKMETYPLSSEKMGREFLLLFSELLSKKISFIKKEKTSINLKFIFVNFYGN